MIPKKIGKPKTKSSGRVGLSYSPYFKKSHFISKNPDYNSVPDTKEHQLFEYSIGGSWCRISDQTIDPYTTQVDDKVIPIRGSVKYFSRKSRGRLLQLVSKLDKSKCDPKSVLFITLTSPSVGWRDVSGKEWKKRLNNFNTQLRQTFGKNGLFCGVYRLEFQKRGSPHFHIVTYNVPYIDHNWVREKWNKICCKGLSEKETIKHFNSGTQVQVALSWNGVNDYFSKTMSYVCKDENWKVQPKLPDGTPDTSLIEWMSSFGNHWGVICRDNLKKMTEVVVGEFKHKSQYNKVRRVVRKYIQSSKKRKLKGNYSSKKSKLLNRVFSQKQNCKNIVFMSQVNFERLLVLFGWDGEIIRVDTG